MAEFIYDIEFMKDHYVKAMYNFNVVGKIEYNYLYITGHNEMGLA